jgi:WD40 repeat protein
VEDKPTSILSLDFDDTGDLLMTSESDESIQLYNVKEGKHQKSCLSKKYGVKLAKFTHASSCIVYASTKENGMLLNIVHVELKVDCVLQMPFVTCQLMTTASSGTSPVTKRL